MDELPLLLVRVAGEASLRLNGAWLDEWVLRRHLSLDLSRAYKDRRP